MWKRRLEEMQRVDDSHDEQRQQQQSAQVCKVRQQEPVTRRWMSMSDMRSDRLMTGSERSGLLDSLPRLFSRLIASFSRSLAFLTPLTTTYELTTTSSEPHHTSLEDEVDWITNWRYYLVICRPVVQCYYSFNCCLIFLHAQWFSISSLSIIFNIMSVQYNTLASCWMNLPYWSVVVTSQ